MGTLIEPSWIVTAAQCLEDNPNPSAYKFQLGARDSKNTEAQIQEGALLQPYPGYKNSQKTTIRDYANNIALVKLKAPFKDAAILEFRTNSFPRDKSQKMSCVVLGLVRELVEDQDGFKILQYSHTYGKMFEFCVPMNNKFRFAMRNTLCAAKADDDAILCGGDPGGPLVCWLKESEWTNTGEMELVGVSSWNADGVYCGDIATYTDVGRFSIWMDNIISDDDEVVEEVEISDDEDEDEPIINPSASCGKNNSQKPRENEYLAFSGILFILLLRIIGL